MATATKKAPAKKAAAKKAPAKASAPAKKAPAKSGPSEAELKKLRADIVKRKDGGESVAAIAADLGVNPSVVGDHYIYGTTKREPNEATPARVKAARAKGLGWVTIAAMYGTTKPKVQALFAQTGEDPHASYIGRGGRYGKHEEKVTSAKAATKAAPKEKAAPKAKAALKPIFGDLATAEGALSAEEKETVLAKVDGKKITRLNGTAGGSEPEEIRVKAGSVKVGHQKNGTRVIQFHDGDKTRTVSLASIVKVGR